MGGRRFGIVDAKQVQADIIINKGVEIPLSYYDKIFPPTNINDSSQGFSVGSIWVDVNLKQTYSCVDATLGLAVWKASTEGSWKYTTITSDLNDSIASSYFGTKSGNFDINFYRNNTKSISLENNSLSIYSDHLNFRSGNPSSIEANSLTISATSSLTLDSFEIIENVNSITKNYNNIITTKETALELDVPNLDDTANISYTSEFQNSSRKIKTEIFFYCSEEECSWEKMAHIGRDNTLKIVQDSFTSKLFSDVECSISFSSGVLSISLNNLSGFTNKLFKVLVSEVSA